MNCNPRRLATDGQCSPPRDCCLLTLNTHLLDYQIVSPRLTDKMVQNAYAVHVTIKLKQMVHAVINAHYIA